MRFYGHHEAGPVRNIELRNPSGEVIRSLRPHEVPETASNATRAARDLIRRKLVVHTGVAWQNKAWALFTPEILCGAVLQLDAALRQAPLSGQGRRAEAVNGSSESHRKMVEGGCEVSSLFILAVAQRLSHGVNALLSPTSDAAVPALSRGVEDMIVHDSMETETVLPMEYVNLDLVLAERNGMLAEMCMVAAVDALFHSLSNLHGGPPEASACSEHCPGERKRLTLRLRMGRVVRERRHAAQLTKSLCAVLAIPSTPLGLRSLHLEAATDAWRAEDAAAIHLASTSAWRACAMAVLVGARDTRSPFYYLPSAIVRLILEITRLSSTCDVNFVINCEQAHHESSRNTTTGMDLAFVASFV